MRFGTRVCTFLAFQPKPCRALLKLPQAPHYHRYCAGTAHWHSHPCFVWLQGCLVCAGAVCAENEGLISMSKQIFLLLRSCSVAFTFLYFASCLHPSYANTFSAHRVTQWCHECTRARLQGGDGARSTSVSLNKDSYLQSGDTFRWISPRPPCRKKQKNKKWHKVNFSSRVEWSEVRLTGGNLILH